MDATSLTASDVNLDHLAKVVVVMSLHYKATICPLPHSNLWTLVTKPTLEDGGGSVWIKFHLLDQGISTYIIGITFVGSICKEAYLVRKIFSPIYLFFNNFFYQYRLINLYLRL